MGFYEQLEVFARRAVLGYEGSAAGEDTICTKETLLAVSGKEEQLS